MIKIYKYNGFGWFFLAGIDENDASVTGNGELASHFRDGLDSMREQGYKPEDHIDKIRDRIYDNFRTGYYLAI